MIVKINKGTVMEQNNVDELKERHREVPISNLLNVQLLDISPGYAKVTMKLKAEYNNFHGRIFGGIIMSLADIAFGYAVNSLKEYTVAAQFNIQFIAATNEGDELIAEAKVIKEGRRAILAEMMVVNQDNQLVAKATGTGIPTGE
jgi:acyl-CoA thioesterase